MSYFHHFTGPFMTTFLQLLANMVIILSTGMFRFLAGFLEKFMQKETVVIYECIDQ